MRQVPVDVSKSGLQMNLVRQLWRQYLYPWETQSVVPLPSWNWNFQNILSFN